MPFFSRYASSALWLSPRWPRGDWRRQGSDCADSSRHRLQAPACSGRSRTTAGPGRVVVGGREAGDGLGRRRLATASGRSRPISPTPTRIDAASYGFRSGQHTAPRLGLVPRQPCRLQRCAVRDPEDHPRFRSRSPNEHLREIARIWKHEAELPLGTGSSATRWTFDHLGVGPDPGRLCGRRRTACRGTEGAASVSASPSRIRRRSHRCRATQAKTLDARLFARRTFTNTSLLLAKARRPTRRRTGSATGRHSAARVPQIACSSPAPPATSGASS